ncbi:MAG: YSC84-related protein [Planctomycetota bacterium]
MKHVGLTVLVLGALLVSLGGCSTAPKSQADREALARDVQIAIEQFESRDAGLAALFDQAHAYAVFPSVGKGAVGVGGAYGRGQAFEGGQVVGFCDLTQATIGLQLGGQAYSEVIFFEDAQSFERFKFNNLEFSAQVSAVAANAGASADAAFRDGVMVFTMTRGGLMYEASVGGQGFTFEPIPSSLLKPKPVSGGR